MNEFKIFKIGQFPPLLLIVRRQKKKKKRNEKEKEARARYSWSQESSDKCISISPYWRGVGLSVRSRRMGKKKAVKRAKAISNGPSGGKRSRANSDLEKLKL